MRSYNRPICGILIVRRYTIDNDIAMQSSSGQIGHAFVVIVFEVWFVLREKFEPFDDYELVVWGGRNVGVGKGYLCEVFFGLGLFFIWDYNLLMWLLVEICRR